MRVLPYVAAAAVASRLLACDDHPDATSTTMPPAPVEAAEAGLLTKQPAQAKALVADARVKPILTVGDPLPGQAENPDPEQRVWAPTPDL